MPIYIYILNTSRNDLHRAQDRAIVLSRTTSRAQHQPQQNFVWIYDYISKEVEYICGVCNNNGNAHARCILAFDVSLMRNYRHTLYVMLPSQAILCAIYVCVTSICEYGSCVEWFDVNYTNYVEYYAFGANLFTLISMRVELRNRIISIEPEWQLLYIMQLLCINRGRIYCMVSFFIFICKLCYYIE